MPRLRAAALALLLAGSLAATGAHAAPPEDPLKSPMWELLAARFFGQARVVLDDRVKISAPGVIEDQAQVPVTVDARAIGRVEKLVVFADLNPIQHVLTLEPARANAFIAFRMKLEQASPVRAGALTADGVWHVGSLFVEAAGGGCTSAAVARQDDDWAVTLGRAQGRLWPGTDGASRLRLRLRHPMDTGLAKGNIPAFYIEHLGVRAASGVGLATLELSEPVAEDPTISLDLLVPAGESAITAEGRDNNGTLFRSVIPTSRAFSAAPAPGQ